MNLLSEIATLTLDAQLFRDVFNNSPIGIAVENLDGESLFVNPAFCSMLGFSDEELRSKHCVDFSPPEDTEKDWTLFQQLRAGSIDHYQLDKRYFRRDGSLMWGRLTISLLKIGESQLVLAMVDDIAQRKRAEALLQSREELLKIFVKNVPAPVAMFDRGMRYLEVSDRWCTVFAVDGSQILGRSHYDVFPDLPERHREVHRRGLGGETVRAEEDCWEREGGTKWVRWEVRPWDLFDGTPGGIFIFAEDITRRKEMEEALSTLSRKLLYSQEQERSRIGRELHDDINQRLAMLAVSLEKLTDDPSKVQTSVQEIRQEVMEISSDVQALSHELHSSKLEYLGVVPGMKSWCKEFAERQRIVIDFRSDVQAVLPLDVGLSLFRVLQEALHNVVKHSGAERIEVQLREDSSKIHLIVIDSGRGFDVDAAMKGRGIGLVSMRERVRLVNGTMTIDSKPMRGTTIHVRIPIPGC